MPIDPQPVPIVEVTLPASAHVHITGAAPNPDAAIAAANAPAEVVQFVSQLRPPQRELLVDVLDHSLNPGHGARVLFYRQRVGYELTGTFLRVTDRTVTENATNPVSPIEITFVEQDP